MHHFIRTQMYLQGKINRTILLGQKVIAFVILTDIAKLAYRRVVLFCTLTRSTATIFPHLVNTV